MKKKKFEMTRRQVLKAGLIGGAGLMMPLRFLPAKAFANGGGQACDILGCANFGLSNPGLQPKFKNLVPDALTPGFKILTPKSNDTKLKIFAGPAEQWTGLRDPANLNPSTNKLYTPIWGYGQNNWNGGIPTWPGPTLEAKSNRKIEVKWENDLGFSHLLPVDTSLHWAYSLPGYTDYTITADGVPMVAHLHGGHSDFQSDGNPEFFFSPGFNIKGPQFVDKTYVYDNDQPAGNLWYHDHALGITRLNVYAGLAGFYFLRDRFDTGDDKNKLDLPAWPYEKAYAIQDRMFKDNGDLFYPAFIGDPYYADFIETPLPTPPFDIDTGGPTALAEFFGDHMVVNGMIWPKEDVEPRNYRLHLLNGTDSRFMAIQFFEVPSGATDFTSAIGSLDFTVIGSDQGLASSPTTVDTLLSEPGSRYDIIVDFSTVTPGNRVIMKNIGGDEPFGGEIPGPVVFTETDRIMAFDVILPFGALSDVDNVSPTNLGPFPAIPAPTRTRKVALFEGMDEFGRLQPLLGTAEPATDYADNAINWPDKPVYSQAVLPDGTSSPLIGPMGGSIAWHSPTTENPSLGSTEEWEIYNVTGDAHPVHLHLVHFEIIGRDEIKWDTNADDDGFLPNNNPANASGDGTYVLPQPTVQHNSVPADETTYGEGFKIVNATKGIPTAPPEVPDAYVENAPKDMVTALPGQVTRIRMTFDKPGRYVWHCHILSHEDHEMMRVLHVGEGA